MRLPRLLRTTSFRLTALYSVLFGACVVALGTATYWRTNATLQDQVRRRIEAEAALLQQEMNLGDLSRLIATLRARAATGRNYFLLDPSGRWMAGDLPVVPDRLGWTMIESGGGKGDEGGDASDPVRIYIVRLDGGYRLGIGEDLEQVGEFADIVLGTLLPALGIVLILGVGGGLVLSGVLLRRIDAVTRTAEAIIAGDLSRRIAVTGSDDDFDRLSSILNAMLDRIAALMDNLRQVSSDIAHDLRTPLARLRQGLEEAGRRDLTAADYQRAVERAIGEADALLATFSALLRIAQIEAGVARSAFQTVDLSDLMRTIAEAYTPALEEGGRRLEIVVEDGVLIEGDRDLLAQLFINLVENVLAHTPAGTALSMHLAERHGEVSAEIADTGPGIPTDERLKVMRRFYRLEGSRTTPGSGLGLSLVAAVAALHQGRVALTDNVPGLRVIVTLA